MLVNTGLTADDIVACFDQLFSRRFNVRLRGGGEEPLFRPAREGEMAEIHFRADYPASALHEVAHWCLAGRKRHRYEDFGYWYIPHRTAEEQNRFEAVEIKPQALEWIFADAAGVPFRVSSDDVCQLPNAQFSARVAEAKVLMEQQLPNRAQQFCNELNALRQQKAMGLKVCEQVRFGPPNTTSVKEAR